MKSAVLCVFFCVFLYAQPAAIEGVAVHSVTGQPLSGVHVRLSTGSFDTATDAYGAMSDSAGRFSIARIPAGSYMITAERTGFVYVRKANTFTVKAGEHVTDLQLALAPRAIIAGRVLDEYGDPVPHVSVMLETVSGTPAMVFGMYGATDDRGEFRLRAGPGKYRVRATAGQMQMMAEFERSGSGGSEAVVPTYYPNTPDRDQASVVEVAAGGEINGIEIRLARRPAFSIGGTVSGTTESVMAMVMLQKLAESPRRAIRSTSRGIQRDGKFSFGAMEPGSYRVYAYVRTGKVPLQSQVVEFRLESADVANLQLALAPGGEIAGTLEFAGGGVLMEKRTVRLLSDVVFERQPSGQVDKQGAFRFGDVLPDRYRVQVDPLPENAYVKAVQLDGAAVPDVVLDLSGGVRDTKLKIIVGRNGGQLSGSLLDKDGQPIGTEASVFLLQDPADARLQPPVRVTPGGKYTFKAIRPGKYRLFVLDPLRTRFDAGDDPLKVLFSKAEEIEIKEGDRITKDLKVSEGSHDTH